MRWPAGPVRPRGPSARWARRGSGTGCDERYGAGGPGCGPRRCWPRWSCSRPWRPPTTSRWPWRCSPTWPWPRRGHCSPGRPATSRWPPRHSTGSAPTARRCSAPAWDGRCPSWPAPRPARCCRCRSVCSPSGCAGPYFAILTFGLSELVRHTVIWYEIERHRHGGARARAAGRAADDLLGTARHRSDLGGGRDAAASARGGAWRWWRSAATRSAPRFSACVPSA